MGMNPTNEELQNIIEKLESVSQSLEMNKTISPGEFQELFLVECYRELTRAAEMLHEIISQDDNDD